MSRFLTNTIMRPVNTTIGKTPTRLIQLVGINFIDSVVLDHTIVEDLTPIADLCELRVLAIHRRKSSIAGMYAIHWSG